MWKYDHKLRKQTDSALRKSNKCFVLWHFKPFLYVPVVLHRGDLRERQRHGGDSGQRRLLSNHRRARPEPRGGAKHSESNAFLRHVRLLRTVRLSRQYLLLQTLEPLLLDTNMSDFSDCRWFVFSRSVCRLNLVSPAGFCWLFPTWWASCAGLLHSTSWATAVEASSSAR